MEFSKGKGKVTDGSLMDHVWQHNVFKALNVHLEGENWLGIEVGCVAGGPAGRAFRDVLLKDVVPDPLTQPDRWNNLFVPPLLAHVLGPRKAPLLELLISGALVEKGCVPPKVRYRCLDHVVSPVLIGVALGNLPQPRPVL
mmetsp:Transcript_21270/g.25639  ORF Transcript_21270/g.25639 Transcript_21270/m.25639 type:complete len:141 (-) Transcript_21270:269-691(-)